MKFCCSILCGWVLLGLLSSCTSYRYIDIQVLQPGNVKSFSAVSKLHVIKPQKIDTKHKIVIKDTALNKGEYFKLLINAFDSALINHLLESPKFQQTQIVIQNEDEFRNEMKSTSNDEKKNQLSLTVQKLFLTDTIKPEADLDEYDYQYAYAGFYSISYLFKIDLKNIGNQKMIKSHVFFDTLTWTGKGNSAHEIKSHLPTPADAIKETGGILAKRYAEEIAPYWSTEERMLYYHSNKYLIQGYNSFVDNYLDDAIRAWKQLYENGTRHLASIAAHNIGLAYEMLDDLDNSELWLQNSLNKEFHVQTEKYVKQIKIREKLRSKLDNQLNQ